jgi:hypothetical protein
MATDWLSFILADNMRKDARESERVQLAAQSDYLAEIRGEKRVELERIDKKEKDLKATGETGRADFLANLKGRVSSGFIGEESAQKSLEDYYNRYGIAAAPGESTQITDTYKQFAPKQRAVQLSALYQRTLGRPATTTELADKESQMALGRTLGDVELDIQSSPEYKNQRPSSAYEAEQEARYGGPVLDPVTGLRTKTYKSDFSTTALPVLSAELQKQIGITAPAFIGKPFIGTADDIENAKIQRNNYESYLYNSGIKALEGNINERISNYAQDKETDRNTKTVQGQIDVADIVQKGQKVISDFAQGEETKRTGAVIKGQQDLEDIRIKGQQAVTAQTIQGDIKKGRQQQAYGLLQSAIGAFNF